MNMLLDWVKQGVSGTPGTGAITLGSAASGYIRFQDDSRLTDGATVYYTIEDGANRERGIGTYSSTGPTLTRSIIQAKIESGTYSENPGAGLNLTSAAMVSCSPVATPMNFRGALLYHSTTQSIVANSDIACEFDSEVFDTDGYHDVTTNNTRLTIPTGVSLVRLTCSIRFAANAAGVRFGGIRKNGSVYPTPNNYIGIDVDSSTTHGLAPAPLLVPCASGDYFELVAYQSSGGSLNVNPSGSGHFFMLEVVK